MGTLLTIIGMVGGSETSQLAGGYGLLMAGAAVYLLGGLGLRQLLGRRSAAPRASSPAISRATVSTPQS